MQFRTVPTKFKGFCARVGPCGKSRSLQGRYWRSLESTKKNWGSHAFLFEIKMLTSAFSGKDISFQISIEFTFKYRKVNLFIKILKLRGKW